MELVCKRCGHVWDYTGGKHYPGFANCPYCYNKVRIPEEKKGNPGDEVVEPVQEVPS